jgi:hypothetical protein
MLGNFNKSVLIVASVLLILGLIIIGFFITKSIENSSYPPIISDCPDYWDVAYNADNKKICTPNSINDGKTSCRNYPLANFTAFGSTEADILCAKKKWAKDCNIHWDGVTNNSQACLKTTI